MAKVNKDMNETAKRIAREYGVGKVYVNDKGEYFTDKCNAYNSVDDCKKIRVIDCTTTIMKTEDDKDEQINTD